ncbi:hypothetical protein AWENTII_010031 [Aspergillus wentii]
MSQRLQPSHFSLEFSIRPTLFHSPVYVTSTLAEKRLTILLDICETLTSDQSIKVVILASPGNPTGSLIPVKHIKRILNLETFHGLLVVDEAYIDFSSTPEDASTVQLLSEYANLVVVQSLS